DAPAAARPPSPVAAASPDAAQSSESSDTESQSSSEDESPRRAQQNTPCALSTARSPLATPEPRPTPVPSFLGDTEDQDHLRQRFRKFWMASVVDAFSDDLGRFEANLSIPRLALLIDSLAAGADVFSSSHGADNGGIDETDVAM
ncbi:uncharacterized protein B0H18DRAFT_819308, partial [Fomitopsis serialis]|uniref:uncharacterized protein n=1 Tax=Fomitopsis serialis TaxID=139415 RepID=UPI002007ECD9